MKYCRMPAARGTRRNRISGYLTSFLNNIPYFKIRYSCMNMTTIGTIKLNGKRTIRDLYQDVHKQVQNAIKYSCYPYEDLDAEVVSEDVRDWQTNYTLKGVNGKFNSCWFDEIQKNSIFLAIADHKPTISSRCECWKLEMERGRPVLIPWLTSPVREISDMGNNIYRVVTRNNTYIIQVGYQVG